MPGPSFSPDFYEKHWAAVNRKYDIQQELAHAQAQEALAHGQLYGQQATVLTPAQAFNLRASGQLDVERAATEANRMSHQDGLDAYGHMSRTGTWNQQYQPPAAPPAAAGAPAAGAPPAAAPGPTTAGGALWSVLPPPAAQDRQLPATPAPEATPPPASSTPPPPAVNQPQSSFEQKAAKPAATAEPLPTFSGRGGGSLEDLFSPEPLARRKDYLKYKAAGDADIQPLRKGSANVSKGGKAAKSAKSGGKGGKGEGGGGEPGGLEQLLPALLAAARGPGGPDAGAAGPQAGDAMAPPMAPGAGAPPGFAEGTTDASGAGSEHPHAAVARALAAELPHLRGMPGVRHYALGTMSAMPAMAPMGPMAPMPPMPPMAPMPSMGGGGGGGGTTPGKPPTPKPTPDPKSPAPTTPGPTSDATPAPTDTTPPKTEETPPEETPVIPIPPARPLIDESTPVALAARGSTDIRAGLPGARRFADGSSDISGMGGWAGSSRMPSLTPPSTGGTWTPGFARGAPNVQPQPNYPFGAGYLFGATAVPGQGTGKVDKVPAELAPHEAVLNRAAADMLGRGKIAALNAAGVRKMGLQRGAR